MPPKDNQFEPPNDLSKEAQEAFARYLQEQFDAALLSNDSEAIKRAGVALSGVDQKFRTTSNGNIDVAAHEAQQHEEARAEATRMAEAVVPLIKDVAAKSFYEHFEDGHKYKTTKVQFDRNGRMSVVGEREVDGRDLKNSFAKIEAGKMDDEQLAQLQQNVGSIPDKKRMNDMADGLTQMEEYNAAVIKQNGGSDADLRHNHEVFERARNFATMMANNIKGQQASHLHAAAEQYLASNRPAFNNAIDDVYAVLFKRPENINAVSGDVSERSKHGLPDALRGDAQNIPSIV